MSNSRVWLNGQELGGRPYGYIGFGFDLTPYLKFGGQENVLAVRLAPEEQSSRWYPGAGIYRNVWLDVTGPVHVARWGTYITTPRVTDAQATVSVKTEVRNQSSAAAASHAGDVDPRRRRQAGRAAQPATSTRSRRRHSRRWRRRSTSPTRSAGISTTPYLYTLASDVREGNRVVDRYVTPFGIRTIAFDKAKGFLLNGRAVKLQGVCMHHDLGALGAAVNRRATSGSSRS